MSEAKRLHPVSAIINVLKSLKESIVPLLFLVVFGDRDSAFNIWMIIPIVIIVISLLSGLLSWITFTYRVEEGELRIESGLFFKKKRYIPFDRIQSLDFSEGVLQRPFGLVKVTVETASSSSNRAEAELTAVKKEEAIAIQEILASAKHSVKAEDTEREEQEVLYKITPLQLILLASTSGGAGVVISGAVAFILQFDELIPYDAVFKELQGYISNGVMFVSMVIFFLLFLAWLLALFGTMLKYADFTVKKVDHDIIISRGLIEKRQLTIPLHRVQGIVRSENLIRQPLGYCSVHLETAGGSLEQHGSRALLLPIVGKKEVESLLSPFFPDYHFTPEITPAPKRAVKRYLLRNIMFPFLLVVIALIFFRPFGYVSLLLLPLAITWAILKHRDAGWSLEGNQLTLTFRRIIKQTVYLKKNKIQSLSVSKSYLQQKQSLSSIDVSVVSGIGGSGGSVDDLESNDIIKMYHWYQYEKGL